MDVKDVNNSIGQLLFNKGAAVNSSQQALGAGFANLLAGQTAMALDIVADRSSADKAQVDVSVSKKPVVADDKKSVSNKEKTSVAEKNTSRKNKKTAADEASSIPANVAAEKPVQQENKVTAENQTDKTVVSTEDTAGADTRSSVLEDNAEVQPVKDGKKVWQEMTITPVLSGEDAVVATFAGDDIIVLQDMSDLQALASMSSVSVFDRATGEIQTMSGAELLEKIKTASASGDLFVTGRTQGKMVEMVPVSVMDLSKEAGMSADGVAALQMENSQVTPLKQEETVAKAAGEYSAEQGWKQQDDIAVDNADIVSKAENRNVEHNMEKFAYADERLAEQAAFLDEKIAAEHKVKVDVKVNEAKIAAAATTSDLLQDDFALRDIWVSADEGAVKVENPAVQGNANPTTATAKNSTVLNADYLAAALPEAAAGIKVIETVAASVSNSAMAAETVSAPMSHAVAAGSSEFVNQARAESAKTTETSFRDVLKGMEREVVDQVKVNITKSAVKGVDKINIQLKPEDLGHIEIKMQISKDGKLQAHIISSRPETMEILQKEIQSLEQAFNDAGFETEDGSLSFSFREGNETGQDSNSELRSFLGNMFEADEVVETAGNDNLENWNPTQGLNIRV